MGDPVSLIEVRLVPVVELEPWVFVAPDRPRPEAGDSNDPDAWDRYWRDALADAGLAGLEPIRHGSWHVPTNQLTDPAILRNLLAAVVVHWGGVDALTGEDAAPVLDGGLALCSGGEVLVEPGCCVDLGNLADWRAAAGHDGAGWAMLWVGHPWLSVRRAGGRLVLSGPHESAEPVARWAVGPDALASAVGGAEAELEAFAGRLRSAVAGLVCEESAGPLARRLAGCDPDAA